MPDVLHRRAVHDAHDHRRLGEVPEGQGEARPLAEVALDARGPVMSRASNSRHVHELPRDTVVRRERCTEAERVAELASSGREALEWRRYADGSLGLVLGPEVRRGH